MRDINRFRNGRAQGGGRPHGNNRGVDSYGRPIREMNESRHAGEGYDRSKIPYYESRRIDESTHMYADDSGYTNAYMVSEKTKNVFKLFNRGDKFTKKMVRVLNRYENIELYSTTFLLDTNSTNIDVNNVLLFIKNEMFGSIDYDNGKIFVVSSENDIHIIIESDADGGLKINSINRDGLVPFGNINKRDVRGALNLMIDYVNTVTISSIGNDLY